MARSYRIVWAPSAVDDLEDILDHVAGSDTPESAHALCSKVVQRIEKLRTNPRRCRIVPELREVGVTKYRELVVAPYRVFFHLSGRTVNLIGVLDGRRELEEILIRRVIEG